MLARRAAWPTARRIERSALPSGGATRRAACSSLRILSLGVAALVRGARLAARQEEQEAVGAHGVEADDVVGAEDARSRAAPRSSAANVAHGAVVGRPAELGLVPAGAPEVEVDDLDAALRLEQPCGRPRCTAGSAGSPVRLVEELALEAQPLGPQPEVVGVSGESRSSQR